MAGKSKAKAPVTDGEQNDDDAPEGFTAMYHEDCGGITIDGEAYEVVDGVAYIANHHVDEARIHGFSDKAPK